MIFTILTSTLDLVTPYTTSSPLTSLALYLAASIMLTARLLVFGSVLSMEPEGDRTPAGIIVCVCYFLGSYLTAIILSCVFERCKFYHHNDAAFHRRTANAHYRITVKTGAQVGAGTSGGVHLTLIGDKASQSVSLSVPPPPAATPAASSPPAAAEAEAGGETVPLTHDAEEQDSTTAVGSQVRD